MDDFGKEVMVQQSWKKLGLIFSPNQRYSWMVTHAQQAVADYLGNDIYRIYFSCRDHKGYPRGASFDLDLKSPKDPFNISDKPVLDVGNEGAFDAHGVYPSSIVNINGYKHLYYAGWANKPNGFDVAIGLSISSDNSISFQKRAPSGLLLQTSNYDPWMVSSPWVFGSNNVWQMIYISGISSKVSVSGDHETLYNLKQATSSDGIIWKRNGDIAIDFFHDGETNIARPSIIEDQGIFKMWFSYACLKKGISYRCGYAESKNGKNWVRKDNLAGIDVSKNGFDSNMICYPLVIKHRGKKYMFYNGNQNGRDGLALAIME